jgi:hypothetical protein
MSKTKLGILAGVAALAGLGVLYFLSKDGTNKISVKFDPKIHNKEYLLDVLEELKIEYASLYLHWYNML